MKEILDLEFCSWPFNTFTDWEKQIIEYLDEHPNIKKVWLVNKCRKTGSTYFAKLLLYFRDICTDNYVISHNLEWSKYISQQMPIKFNIGIHNKDSVWHKASNFLKPVTLHGLEKSIKEHKIHTKDNIGYECMYDIVDFNKSTYLKLCSYDFNFFVITVSNKDLEKVQSYIDEDEDNENVLIVYIDKQIKIT